MNFAKLVSLFAFVTLAVLSLGLASASFSFSSVSGANQSVSAGTQATISFNIDPSTHTGTLFNATLLLPNLFGATTSWSGNSSFTILNTSSTSRTVSVQVPIGQTAGVYTGQISLTGDYITANGNSGAVPTVNNLSIQITVPPQPTSSNLTISAPSTPTSIYQNITLTLTNTGTTVFPSVTLTQTSTPAGVIFNPSTISQLIPGSPQTVTAILNGLNALKFGLHDVNIQASTGSQVAPVVLKVKKTFCSAGETLNSNLTITSIDWSNDGEGDEDSWELLDEIELDVEVRNNNNNKDIDTVIVLGLFDSTGNDVADELNFLEDSDSDSEEIDINIDEDSDETVTFKFQVPADFDADNYKLAVKVYNDDTDQSRDCRDRTTDFDNDFFQTITVEQTSDEGRFIAISDVELDSQVTCGQAMTGQFTVFNVGEDDQDRVRINVRNRDLSISEIFEITSDLDKGDDETMDFRIQIPATASNGNYGLEFFTEYDFKNGVYRQDSDESFVYNLEVIGCSQNLGNPGSGSTLTNVAIDAKLDSEVQSGKELIVTATIRNTGAEDADYSLSARGYSSWAELVDISDATISVDAGESKEVTFTLLVNEDSIGTQAFDIQVMSDGKVMIQEVEVDLSEGMKSLNLGSPLLWVIGLVNLVLIILIIVVAVKLSRR